MANDNTNKQPTTNKHSIQVNGLGITFATSQIIEPEHLVQFLQQNMEGSNLVKHSKDAATLNHHFNNAMNNVVSLLHAYDSTTQTKNIENSSKDCLYSFKTPKEKETMFDKHWKDHFNEVVQFKQTYGHSNVARTTPGYDQLGSWLADQRKKLRRGKLTREQYDMLTSIGVNWDPANINASVLTNQGKM